MEEGKRTVAKGILIHPFPEGNIMLCIPISNSLLVNDENISPENFEKKHPPDTSVHGEKNISLHV